jgi:hypothetical protein
MRHDRCSRVPSIHRPCLASASSLHRFCASARDQDKDVKGHHEEERTPLIMEATGDRDLGERYSFTLQETNGIDGCGALGPVSSPAGSFMMVFGPRGIGP